MTAACGQGVVAGGGDGGARADRLDSRRCWRRGDVGLKQIGSWAGVGLNFESLLYAAQHANGIK